MNEAAETLGTAETDEGSGAVVLPDELLLDGTSFKETGVTEELATVLLEIGSAWTGYRINN